MADGHFSIYRYQKFVEDIVGLSMEDVLKTFSMFLDGARENIVLNYLTVQIFFIRKQCIFFLWGIERLIVILAGHSVCWLVGIIRTFMNQDSYGLLPDDFKIEVGYEGNPFKELFMSWKQFWQQASLHPMLRFRVGR